MLVHSATPERILTSGSHSLDLSRPGFGKIVLVADMDNRSLSLVGDLASDSLHHFHGARSDGEIFEAMRRAGMALEDRKPPVTHQQIFMRFRETPASIAVGGTFAFISSDAERIFFGFPSGAYGPVTVRALELCLGDEMSRVTASFGIEPGERLLAERGLKAFNQYVSPQRW